HRLHDPRIHVHHELIPPGLVVHAGQVSRHDGNGRQPRVVHVFEQVRTVDERLVVDDHIAVTVSDGGCVEIPFGVVPYLPVEHHSADPATETLGEAGGRINRQMGDPR